MEQGEDTRPLGTGESEDDDASYWRELAERDARFYATNERAGREHAAWLRKEARITAYLKERGLKAPTTPRARQPIPLVVRFRVLKRCGFKCVYCGRPAAEVPMEIDHIYPHSRGGSDDEKNLTAACRDCNRGKRAMVLDGDN